MRAFTFRLTTDASRRNPIAGAPGHDAALGLSGIDAKPINARNPAETHLRVKKKIIKFEFSSRPNPKRRVVTIKILCAYRVCTGNERRALRANHSGRNRLRSGEGEGR